MPHLKLFLLDGMALAYRAHFALARSPITNSKGVNTSAVYGFTNTLALIIESCAPTHLAVVFDTFAPTLRHERYEAYKAQREAMPEDLSQALPEIKKLCAAMRIPVLEKDGYEADDLIGTLSTRADRQGGIETFMVTPDKDFAQLVSQTTTMWKPGRKGNEHEVLGLPEILEKWEIEDPKQVIDILGLWGDASDNIPGVPGIGEKTAKKLVARYGSIEGLYEHTDELKGKQKENVEEHRESAFLSKELATIIRDVPLDLELESLVVKEPDYPALAGLFEEWEFRSLAKRLLPNAPGGGSEREVGEQDASLRDIESATPQYELVEGDESFASFFKELASQESYCFDLETTGLNPREVDILGIAVSWETHRGFFLPWPLAEVRKEKLLSLFQNGATKIGHNLKYDLSVLFHHGIEVKGPFLDTMLIHALCYPEQKHSMDALAESLLSYRTIKLKDLVEASTQKQGDLFEKSAGKSKELDMRAVPIEELARYACEDVDVTWQLSEKLLPILKERGMETLYREVEAPLIPVLAQVEMNGTTICEESLQEIGNGLAAKLETLSASITAAAGREFNLNSPKQLGEILFGEMKLVEKPKKTKTGQYVTNEQVLSALAPKHPVVQEILTYREYTKLKGTYVDALPGHVEQSTGRIHTHLHQLTTATGRLASSDPNLQNIPIRSEAGRSVRGAFVPRGEEFTLLAIDYSQIELRVMASLAEDKSMIEAFQKEQDIHTETAAKVFGVPHSEVTREMRSVAKMVNFGIIYGISAFGLSQRLDIPRGEAANIIEAYFEEYPQIRAFMDRTIETGQERGYVETLDGRRRYLPDLASSNNTVKNNAQRAAINTPVQGTAADIIKRAMVEVQAHLVETNCQTRMILQVHDELLFDLHQSERETLIPVLTSLMEGAVVLPNEVPLKVEHGVGSSWLEAH